MKRFVLILMMSLAAAGLWAQDLAVFQEGFESFATDMAATLSYNATIGNNWSDAYIGKFPHLGVGVSVGLTTVPSASLDGLFSSMDIPVPAAVADVGLPIPAAAVSAKLGGLFLPFDIGVKAMILPPEATEALSSAGIAADYKLMGGNVRFALLKQNLLFPDVSVGVGYNRLTGSILMPLDVGSQSYDFLVGPDTHTLAVSDPSLNMEWATDSYDFTIQISKSLLILRPYVGAGYSIGKSTVKGGMKASMTYDDGGGPVDITEDNLQDLKDALADADISVPDISADGFLFGAENTDPVLRLYGGLSLDLLILMFDTQVIYVPETGSLGGTATIRIQL
ncbi:MAG: hypothetical protein A3J97_04655 [Spirochaetes bacterium RIFOXYC1_FULL_54_7]|nr:MAG: hypothetical protein A3J97_04655 [Spirochaetes bacterium RIFOXYC1_FULL_54_7]